MGKKGVIFLSIFVLLAISYFTGCKKKGEETDMTPQATGTEIREYLDILSATPAGSTSFPHESGSFVVIFDQPMVPLEALSEGKGASLLAIDPPVTGRFRWMGTRTLTFTPDSRCRFATEFKVTVPAGATSLAGSPLKKDYTWSFTSIRPRLLQHFPQARQKWLKPETQVLLVFNQAVMKEKAKDFIAFSGFDENNRNESVKFTLNHPSSRKLKEEEIEASPEEVLLLEPDEKLKPGFTYSVELKAGLPAKEGPLGMEKSYIFSFETMKAFAFLGMDTAKAHNPFEPLKFRFSNPVAYKHLVQNIRLEPKAEIPDYYGEWDHGNDILWISLLLQPETKYSLWIDPSLEDEFGNKLEKPISLSFSTGPYPPSVSMTTGHGVVEAYGDLKYPFTAMNTEQIFLQGASLKKEEVIPLLLAPKVFWTSEKFIPKERFFGFEKVLDLPPARNTKQTVPIDLKEILPDSFGFAFLQLDTRSSDKWERYPKAFLQITELGISGKFSPENNLIWVTDLKSGRPVSGASVEIRDDSNNMKWRGVTDNEGTAHPPGWKALGIKSKDQWAKPRQWVFVTKGRDCAFSSSEWGTGISPYRFGIPYDWAPQPVTVEGYIFTEKGIYRAGEEVSVKGILRKREKGQWELPAVKEVICEVQDPFQKSVFKKNIPLDSFGSFALEFELSGEASLGQYQIITTVPPEKEDEKAAGLTESFRVEAFRPAEFEVHLRSQKESYIFGDEYRAEIRANYLFGGAMAGQNVSWHLRLAPASFSPPGHKGYFFGNLLDWDEDEEGEESRLLSSGEGTLDGAGKKEISLRLSPEKEKNAVLATLEATVQGPSRRSISNRIQTYVHRGEYSIGLRPSTTFLKKGDSVRVDIVASSPGGDLIPERKVRLGLVKREWRSVQKAGLGGRFSWMTEKEDTEIASHMVQSQNRPVEASFTPEKSGYYILLAEGQDGRGNKITTSVPFYVTGQDYVPWERRDDDTIELVPDKEGYEPGDRARILVKSPYERSKALVTIERELILESRVVDIEGTASHIDIPVLPEHIPNIFVSVLLVQGRVNQIRPGENEDVGKPSFKVGYINLPVDPSEKKLSVEIQKDREDYRPGDKVTVGIKVKNRKGEGIHGSVALAVVDVGVLNLIGYSTPKPYARFYGQKSLSVQTSDTRLHVVGQREYGEKGEDVGGGGEEKGAPLFMSLAEVELRGDFRSTVFWNPSIETNAYGEATASFSLPGNLTTFRIMAVAQTKESQFGHGETTFRVSKPLLLQPSLPRFARVGDEFLGGVVIHNYSSKKGNVSLSLETKGIKLQDKKSFVTLKLNPGESKEALFPFRVEAPGTAAFAFRARMGEETDGLEVSIPLKLPRPTETVALSGATVNGAEEKISIPEDIYFPESKLEVHASATALSGLRGCIAYLTDYPYYCLEQRISFILPYLVAGDVIRDFQLSRLSPEEVQKYVQKTIRDMYDCQKDNGGFGLWPDASFVSSYVTCYATFALLKAQEAGFAVDKERIERAASYMKNLLREKWIKEKYPYNRRTWRTTQAFALYDLALLNQAEPGYAELLFREREELSLFGKTLLLKAYHHGGGQGNPRSTLIQELWNKVKIEPTLAHFEEGEDRVGGWIYASNTRTTAFILQTMVEIGHNHPLLPSAARWLIEKGRRGHWRSTQENFYVFYALNDYYKHYEKAKADFEAEISLAGKSLLKEVFSKDRRDTVRSEVPLARFGDKGKKRLHLEIRKKGEGILYYGARMTYAPFARLAPRDEGMAVYKKIESLEGKPVESVPAGSMVVVTLEIVVPQESLYVVVDDPLPAGFEAVNPVFLTESQEHQRQLEEREGPEIFRWWEGFNHIELHDERVLLFADSLTRGIHTHRYLARALSAGTFQSPGTKAEEMYAPEVFGRSKEMVIKITK